MELVNALALQEASRKHPQTATWLATWAAVVQAAEWMNITEVRALFPHADAIPLRSGKKVVIVVTCFNVGGNDFRLLTTINYAARRVTVMEVLTHAAYSKGRWKKGLT